jgi:2-polyprenyl-6-methoxyphenol hydroxylase-like FAD-dependent oxidoreductase
LLFEKLEGDTEVIFGDEIVSLEEHCSGVRVQLKHAGERQFDLVIGADGLHSVVRKLAFGPQQGFEKDLGYIVAAFEAGGYRPRDEDTYLMYGQPGRMVGRFTLRDDRTLFLFVFAAGGDSLPSTLDEQKAMLRRKYAAGMWECPSILTELDRATEVYLDRVSQIRMRNWSKGRIALIGDAAFCVSLLAGQGSALTMISAYVLAGELAAAGGQYRQAFDSYEARLRAFIETKQRGAERFAGAFAPKTAWGLYFRNQVIRTFAIPGLARLAIGREIVDTLQLPEYVFPSLPRD